MAKVTSTDVARRAGVSRATVSYVLNDVANQTISSATRSAVLQAAADLGYRPNLAARTLRTGRSTFVLLPLPGVDLGFLVDAIVSALARRLADRDLSLITDFMPYGTAEAQADAWQRLQPAVVLDGFVLDRRVVRLLRQAGVPVVTPWPEDRETNPIDDLATRVRHAQLEHLLTSGHRHLLALHGPQSTLDPRNEPAMLAALHAVAAEHGATLTIDRCDLTADGLHAAVARWRATDPRPTAIAAFNDEYAIGLLTTLTAAGVAVPADVALIGVDAIPLGAALTPTLTTVQVDYEGFARWLADGVDAVLEGRPPTDLHPDDLSYSGHPPRHHLTAPADPPPTAGWVRIGAEPRLAHPPPRGGCGSAQNRGLAHPPPRVGADRRRNAVWRTHRRGVGADRRRTAVWRTHRRSLGSGRLAGRLRRSRVVRYRDVRSGTVSSEGTA